MNDFIFASRLCLGERVFEYVEGVLICSILLLNILCSLHPIMAFL